MNPDMNQDSLESLLASQPLREPSHKLDARVLAAMSEEAPPPRSLRWRSPFVWALGSALAASLAFAVIVTTPNRDLERTTPIGYGGQSVDNATSQTFEVAQTWTRYEPVGDVVYVEDAGPVVPVRQQVVEHKRWIDPENNVQMELTVPREEMYFVAMPVD